MINRLLIVHFLFFGSLLNISCSKIPDKVHFHGRITSDCDAQFPIPNSRVAFHRYYDTGTTNSDFLGDTYTNSDGYYSFTTEVHHKGGFRSYILNMYGANPDIGRPFMCHVESNNDSKDVEINAGAITYRAYGFHIKNVTPYNNSDIFNFLNANELHSDEQTIAANLNGISIDTVLYRFYDPIAIATYNYSFTKNGITTTIPADTISHQGCLDTLIVNIFY